MGPITRVVTQVHLTALFEFTSYVTSLKATSLNILAPTKRHTHFFLLESI